MFLFAVGYGVGPQFVRGVAKDGVPQAIFAVVQCVFCLAGPRRDRQGGRLRPRLRGGAVLGLADDLRRDGPLDRRHQPAGPGRRPGQGAARLDADRLCGDLHVRHRRLGDRDRAARPGAAPHRSARGLQGLRGEAGRRARSLAAPARPGTAGKCVRSGCSRAGRSMACGPSRPRRWFPTRASSSCACAATESIEEATADTVLHEGDVVAVAGPQSRVCS